MRGAHSTPAALFHSLQVPGLEARQLLGLAGQRLVVEEARLLRVADMAQVSALAVCTGMKYGEDGACNSALPLCRTLVRPTKCQDLGLCTSAPKLIVERLGSCIAS